MSRWHARLAAPITLALFLSPAASAGPQEDQVAKLKPLQQRILMSEPAERAEQRERLEAWRAKMKREAARRGLRPGARMKPYQPRTDAGPIPKPGTKTGVAPARISAVDAPTNVLVNNRTGDPYGTCQSEVCLAAQGSRIVATWNDGYGYVTLPSSDTQGFGYSTDGGLTWTDGGAIPNDGTFLWSSDPVVVVNEKTGDFYFTALIDAAG